MSTSRLGFLLVLSLGISAEVNAKPRPLLRNESVAGKPVSDYPALWWQWVNRMRWGVKPFQDPTGAQCGLNQDGQVWFLAGTDGTEDIKRRCTVPMGKYLFLPLITMLDSAAPGVRKSCEAARASVAANNDHLARADVWIDGKPLGPVTHLRMASEHCFDAYPDAPYLDSARSYFPAATDGYWLMLEPLSPGTHTIRVDASYANPGVDLGDLEQVFEYELQVQDSESTQPAAPPQPFKGTVASVNPPRG